MRAATACPGTLGLQLAPLLTSSDALSFTELEGPITPLLKEVFPRLNRSSKLAVERAILGLPAKVETKRQEAALYRRDLLLLQVPTRLLVSRKAKAIRRRLSSSPRGRRLLRDADLSHNDAGFGGASRQESPFAAGHPLKDSGERLHGFFQAHLNGRPELAEVKPLLPDFRLMWSVISQAASDELTEVLPDDGWRSVAAAAQRVARVLDLAKEPDLLDVVRETLLVCSRHPDGGGAGTDTDDESCCVTWGAPRIEAAEGLCRLAWKKETSNERVIRRIQELTEDPAPGVRWAIANGVLQLYDHHRDAMWALIETMTASEIHGFVIGALLTGPLQELAKRYDTRVTRIMLAILARSGKKSVRDIGVGLLTAIHLFRDEVEATTFANSVAKEAGRCARDALLQMDPIRAAIKQGEKPRKRALALMATVVRVAWEGLQEEMRTIDGPASDVAKEQALLLDAAARTVATVVGVHDRADGSEGGSVPRKVDEALFKEIDPIVSHLAAVPLPSATHHLLQALEQFVPIDPRTVFLRLGAVVTSGGSKGGYHAESLGSDLVVRMVRRYLADYRDVLQGDPECRRVLVDVLDVFLHWPNARELSSQLDDIFR
ncbi:MAG: hypothetical protein HY815_16075 [Candidatus Riflebacteria bacterium]|nr:hypothetical protein [Candidatus Riflebacteria bacterium]